ncbi:MAG: hypothetical protein K6C94_07580 [Candidatus Gastranaerophilales bacterium]|nr:hypothetical protein [Candidatus Gastranaerophilales bacterium]
MKTLGFGLKSLLKDPQWAQKHNIDPNNQTAGSVVGDNKTGGAAAQKSIFDRAKAGDVHNNNNIFMQSQNRVNGINAENNIFAQAKVGGASNHNATNNIFEMMNKFDEQHKTLMGAQGVQPMQAQDPMNAFGSDEIQKKLGRKLNLMM